MVLDDVTRAIRDLQAGSSLKVFEAGLLLGEVREGRMYLEKGFASFGDYLEAELPTVDGARAYAIMEVAREFRAEDAERYGIERLMLVCEFAHELFRDKLPRQLLAGRHSFTDGEGRELALAFEQEQSEAALRRLLAAARDARTLRRHEPAGQTGPLRRALEAAAGEFPAFRYQVNEGRGAATLQVQAPLDDLRAILDRVAVFW